jgi:bifunctional non-homologous end joining protein LigD
VYSLRAKERPTVSTPVTWREVEQCIKKKDANTLVFESEDTLKRVERQGDLFAPVLKMKQRLPKVNRMSSELAEHYERYASKLRPAASARTASRAKKRG